MLILLLKGLILGFSIAAPVGPIGLLCIQRSLHDGLRIGLLTGLGAALADGVYGLIAGLGLTAVSSWLIEYQSWIQCLGGLFLIYLGIQFLRKKATPESKAKYETSGIKALSSTFLLTITNPMTVLSFIAVFAGLGLGSGKTNFIHAFALVFGIVAGSALWWLILSTSVAHILRHKLSSRALLGINKFSGLIMLALGVLAIFETVKPLF